MIHTSVPSTSLGVPANWTQCIRVVSGDSTSYVDFMLRDALGIAQRHGSAIVLVHARQQTFDALRRFADRARRDGADIVPITALTAT